MGVFKMGGGSSCGSCNGYHDTPIPFYEPPKLPNPNPKKFTVLTVEGFENGMMLLLVHYEGCTNYEGNKVLVFRQAQDLEYNLDKKELDPHFCDNHPSVFARFAPTQRGMEAARHFCKTWNPN